LLLDVISKNRPVERIVNQIRKHIQNSDDLNELQRTILLNAVTSVESSSNRESVRDQMPTEQRRGPVVLLFGMVRTNYAAQYIGSSIDTSKYFKIDQRIGRDNIRIGELLRRGFEVYSVSAEEYPAMQHINHFSSNFTSGKRQRDGDGHSTFTWALRNALNGTRLDLVLDDWYYIPPNYNRYMEGSFYDTNKWLNVISMKEKGLLNPGCKVIIPAHRDAVKVLYGSDLIFKTLKESINKHFKWSYLMMNEPIELEQNPLWKATQSVDSMKGFQFREDFQLKIAENLSNNFIIKEDFNHLSDEGKKLFGNAEKPRPGFIVLTAK
jgi:hypothetical protein